MLGEWVGLCTFYPSSPRCHGRKRFDRVLLDIRIIY
jgi:hypothetical protein